MNTTDIFNSKEYVVFDYLTRVGNAYTELLNSGLQNLDAAKKALREMQLATNHLEQCIRAALLDWNPRADLVKDLRPWTQDTLDSKYLNSQHHYFRFLHAQTEEQKIKELTGMWSIVVDMQAILEVTRPEQYYKELIL